MLKSVLSLQTWKFPACNLLVFLLFALRLEIQTTIVALNWYKEMHQLGFILVRVVLLHPLQVCQLQKNLRPLLGILARVCQCVQLSHNILFISVVWLALCFRLGNGNCTTFFQVFFYMVGAQPTQCQSMQILGGCRYWLPPADCVG